MTKDGRKVNVTTTLPIEYVEALDDMHFETKVPKCEIILEALKGYHKIKKYL